MAYWRAGFIREKGLLEQGDLAERGTYRGRTYKKEESIREVALQRGGHIREQGVLERRGY